MTILQHGHEIAQGVSCNDRKFETWQLDGLEMKGGIIFNTSVKVQVYVVPKDGFRGAPADGFKIVYKGVAVTSRDLDDLRRLAINLVRDLSEDEHKKVLIIKTSGQPHHSEQGDEFGLVWQTGWQIKKYNNIVYNEDRTYTLDTENYDEDFEPVYETLAGVRIGSKPGHRGVQHNKVAVIPWTQEREDILKKAVKAIAKMRDDLNAALLKPEAFAGLLDAKAGFLALPEGKK